MNSAKGAVFRRLCPNIGDVDVHRRKHTLRALSVKMGVLQIHPCIHIFKKCKRQRSLEEKLRISLTFDLYCLVFNSQVSHGFQGIQIGIQSLILIVLNDKSVR